jgi:peptidyl-prolyl cis-trans isomerase C
VTGPAAAPVPDEKLASIGDVVIPLSAVQKKLDEQSPYVRARYADLAKKKEFVEAYVRQEVLAQEAISRGLDKDPDVQEAVKRLVVQKLMAAEFDNRVKLTDVTDGDMRTWFQAHLSDYNKPQMMRVMDIAIPFGSDKATAHKKADAARARAADPGKLTDREAFKQLVVENCTDADLKHAGGDRGFLVVDEAKEKLGSAGGAWLFKGATIDEVSPVLESKDAFHVLKRISVRAPIERGFDDVKDQIRNVVYRDKRTAAFNEYVHTLKSKFNVSIDSDKIDKLHVDAVTGMNAPADPHAGLGIHDDGMDHKDEAQ